MSLLGIGEVIGAVGKVATDLITTDKERLQFELEGRKLDQAIDLAQIEVNKAEATNPSVFVSGWRPFIGWGCGFAFLYIGLFEPMVRFIAKVVYQYNGDFPVIDTTITMQVLFGLLGLAGMRSYEKTKGIAK